MNRLIVLLDRYSPPFCYYSSARHETVDGGFMSLEVLQQVVDYSIKMRVSLNFILGERQLPAGYQALIEESDHIKFVPLSCPSHYEDAIVIVDAASDMGRLDQLDGGKPNNIIFLVGRNDVDSLDSSFRRLLGKFRRMNLILTDLKDFDDVSLALYEARLQSIRRIVEDMYRRGEYIEVSTVTDRMFLINMNNCNAGVDHLTVAPNGKVYLCPAFYFDSEADHIGELGREFSVVNKRLLELDQAPICRSCDAYQCKRCIYLNKKLTLEMNTPSRQQCRAAHVERNTSRQLMIGLGTDFFVDGRVPAIPAINYLDPFDVINDQTRTPKERQRHFSELLSRPLESLPVHELFEQIHSLDSSMLAKLKSLNQGRLSPTASLWNYADIEK